MSNKIKKFSVIIPLFGILTFVLIFSLLNCGNKPVRKTMYERGAYAVQFTGNADNPEVIDFGYSFSYKYTPISAEAWIKTSATSGGVVKGGDKEAGFFLYVTNAGTAAFRVHENPADCRDGETCFHNTADSNVNVDDGQWHHIAGTLDCTDPDNCDCYVDGEPDPFDDDCIITSTVNVGGGGCGIDCDDPPVNSYCCRYDYYNPNAFVSIYVDGIFRASSSAKYIQNRCRVSEQVGWDEAAIETDSTQYAFDGIIDEVRIWQEARTGTMILAAMNTEITGKNWNQLNPNGNLQGYWKFNEGQGISISDSSGTVALGSDPPTANNGIFERCISACDD